MSTAINQLQAIGSNVLVPFTNQIAQVLADMQSNIDSLTKRIETLESKNKINMNTTSTKVTIIKLPKSTKTSKSAPVSPNLTSVNKSKHKKISDYKKKARKNAKKEPETQTETEQKEESKETEETEPTLTDNIAVVPPVIAKERGPKKNIKFSFQNNHNTIKQTDNGSAAIKPKFKPGSIRLGKYISKADGDYAAYKFTFDTKGMGPTPSGYAFGLVTKGFNDYSSSNFGQNGSVMIKGNGQYITTDGTFINEDRANYVHKQIIPMFKDGGMLHGGDVIVMEVDLQDSLMKIWNETRNDGKIFRVSIPNKPVCPMVYMGGSAKRKIVVSQQCAFKYKDEE